MRNLLLFVLCLGFIACNESVTRNRGNNNGPDSRAVTDEPTDVSYALPSGAHKLVDDGTFRFDQISYASEVSALKKDGYLPTHYLSPDLSPATASFIDKTLETVAAERPDMNCGNSPTFNTIKKRIADCATVNTAKAIWDGRYKATGTQSIWRLVTKSGTNEIWLDVKTGLIWSYTLGKANWCKATGNTEDHSSVDCDDLGGDDEEDNWCADDIAGLRAAKGELNQNPDDVDLVSWRLPTKADFMQAHLDGIEYVLPDIGKNFWTSTPSHVANDKAWYFKGSGRTFFTAGRSGKQFVRCVGRVLRYSNDN